MFSAVFALASFLDPETLISKGGLLLVAAIIFAESGLLIGFFLPGDSLLFITGFLASVGPENKVRIDTPIWIVVALLFVAAVTGDQVGYLFGRKVGPSLFNRPDSKLFKQANVDKAQAFFNKHGAKAIVLARFVPIVRTFTPILAGVSRMHYRTFVKFNVIGGALWACGVTLLGYFLGQVSWIKNNIEVALLGIVVLSLVPVAIELLKHRRSAHA